MQDVSANVLFCNYDPESWYLPNRSEQALFNRLISSYFRLHTAAHCTHTVRNILIMIYNMTYEQDLLWRILFSDILTFLLCSQYEYMYMCILNICI